MIVAEARADPSLAKIDSVRDGRALATDGPVRRGQEHLAGLLLVDCESMKRALEHEARVPEAEFGLVEVRPVMGLSAYEV